MTADKVQAVRGKVLGHFNAQSPIKNRSAAVVVAFVVILLLALSSLVYLSQVSRSCDMPSYVRAPECGYMLAVPKNASRYVRYPDTSIPNLKGNRCGFVIFSETKEVRISFANYSFQPSSSAGVIVAELSDDGGDELKYSKLNYSGTLIAKTPSVIYYTSDEDEKQNSFVIKVSPIESSGSSGGFPQSASMVSYTKTGVMKRHYPSSASYPMAYLGIFGASPTSQPGRHFTCSPRNSTCCNAISLYRLPTIKLGGTASRLTGLSTGGVKVGSEVTVAMMFGLPSNFDASAGGATCLFEWDAVKEMEVDIDNI